ncbi:MAG: ferritin family protein [Elusimicrobiota bacterium]
MNEEILKGIINEEKVDVFLYATESELFKNKIVGGKAISETFSDFAAEEAEHIKTLLSLCKKRINVKYRKIIPFKSLRKNLRVHLVREADSVKLYEVFLNSVSGYEEKEAIKKIIENEKKHLSVIKKYLLTLK